MCKLPLTKSSSCISAHSQNLVVILCQACYISAVCIVRLPCDMMGVCVCNCNPRPTSPCPALAQAPLALIALPLGTDSECPSPVLRSPTLIMTPAFLTHPPTHAHACTYTHSSLPRLPGNTCTHTLNPYGLTHISLFNHSFKDRLVQNSHTHTHILCVPEYSIKSMLNDCRYPECLTVY